MIHCSSLPPFAAIGELASKRMSGASRKVLFSYHPPYRHTVPPSACLSSPPAPFGTSLACVSLSRGSMRPRSKLLCLYSIRVGLVESSRTTTSYSCPVSEITIVYVMLLLWLENISRCETVCESHAMKPPVGAAQNDDGPCVYTRQPSCSPFSVHS